MTTGAAARYRALTRGRVSLISPTGRGVVRPVAKAPGDVADAIIAQVKEIATLHVGVMLSDADIKAIAEAVRQGNTAAIDVLLPDISPKAKEFKTLLDNYRKVLGQVANASGKDAVAAIGIADSFLLDNPYVVDWLKNETAALVTNVTQDVRRNIAALVEDAWTNGIPVDQLADTIRPIIGLTEIQYGAVGRRFEDAIASGMSPAQASEQAQAYAEQLLDQRAETIARTETIAAQNAGTRSAWESAQEQGYLLPNTRKEWIASESERTCPICMDLNGQVVGLNETFISELIDNELDGPPAHPNCRCTTGIHDSEAAVNTTPPTED